MLDKRIEAARKAAEARGVMPHLVPDHVWEAALAAADAAVAGRPDDMAALVGRACKRAADNPQRHITDDGFVDKPDELLTMLADAIERLTADLRLAGVGLKIANEDCERAEAERDELLERLEKYEKPTGKV